MTSGDLCVAGVRFEGRQKYVRKLREGDPVSLKWDRANTYSNTAIAVYDRSGNQIGFVPDERSEYLLTNVIPTLSAARVSALLPPTDRYPDSVGVVIEYEYVRPPRLPTAGESQEQHEREQQRQRKSADRSLSDEYEDLLDEILLDGVVTVEEETSARIFASGVPSERVRGIHAKILRKVLQRAVRSGTMSSESEQQVRKVNGLLARLGWAP